MVISEYILPLQMVVKLLSKNIEEFNNPRAFVLFKPQNTEHAHKCCSGINKIYHWLDIHNEKLLVVRYVR